MPTAATAAEQRVQFTASRTQCFEACLVAPGLQSRDVVGDSLLTQ
jgi:NADH:ubiquinone oxidoreductase subunit E